MKTQPPTSRQISWNRVVDVADPDARVFEPQVWDFGRGRKRTEPRGREYGQRVADTSVVEPKGEGRSGEPR